jgi:hypothetical protein
LSGIGHLVREITEATGKKIISRPSRERILLIVIIIRRSIENQV